MRKFAIGAVCALCAMVGIAWVDVYIDLHEEPPAVVFSGEWLTSCERTEVGLACGVMSGAPDLRFTFIGVSEEVELGYTLWDANGVRVGSGSGTWVALEGISASVVEFTALSGELDWTVVSEVSVEEAEIERINAVEWARTRSVLRQMQSTEGLTRMVSASGGFDFYEPTTATVTLTPLTNALDNLSFADMTLDAPTMEIASLDEILLMGNYNPGENGFSVAVNGSFLVAEPFSFKAGADDEANVTVGEANSFIDGEHALQWGNLAEVTETGLLPMSATFLSVGGPYNFRVDGIPDMNFYRRAGTLPYATLSLTPETIKVPWSGGTPTSSASYTPVDSRVSYELTGAGNGNIITYAHGTFTVNGHEFLLAGAQPVTAEVTLTQSYVGQTHTSTKTLTVNPSTTSVTLSSKTISINNAVETLSKSITVTGEHPNDLTYEVASTNLIAFADGKITVGPDVLAFRRQCMEEKRSETKTWTTDITWTAYYEGVPVATGTDKIAIVCSISSKVQDTCPTSCCAEGTQSGVDNACVSFRQAFGRTPLLAGMPDGFLVIEENNLTDALFTPSVLKYDHPMMRRLNPRTRVVTDALGNHVTYGNDGYPINLNVAANSRLEALEGGLFCEVFSDRSSVEYNTTGAVVAITSADGVRAELSDLGITITYDANGAIASIESVTDGTLTVNVTSPTSYSIVWTDTNGVVNKTFTFAKEGTDTLFLMDGPYPVRWRWMPEAHDFAMTRGVGDDAATIVRTVDYEGSQVNVTKTTSRGTEVASSSTQTIDSLNGNAVVGETSGGRTTLSATRVTDGDGLGRSASQTDAYGATTSYTYDSEGRVLTQTTVGAVTTEITYTYSTEKWDRRPWTTVETVNGVVVREASFSEAMLFDGGKVETTTDCGLTTIRAYYPASSENRFEAGRLWRYLRPNGRMTEYTYDAETLVETATEGIDDGDGNLELVSGKSMRTKNTYDICGNIVRIDEEVYIGETWVPWTWETRTYSASHKHLGSVYSNGKSTDSRWNCSGPLWEIGTDGILTTNTYNSLKQMVTSTREGSHGTLVTTYAYDAAGRVIGITRGELTSSKSYDQSGRVLTETDEQGRVTSYAYPSELQTIVTLPGGGTRITTLNADGQLVSITGTAVTPEYYTYGPNWMQVNYGTPTGTRWVKTTTDGLGRTISEERSGANGSTITTTYTYNDIGQLTQVETTGEAPIVYTYDAWGDRVTTQVGDRAEQSQTTAYILVGDEPWQETVSTVANLTQRSRINAEGTEQVTTDVRGNETVTTIEDEGAQRTMTTVQPGVANPTVTVQVDGVTTQITDSANVMTSATYDAYQRPVTQTDGRGNTTTQTYNALGQLWKTTDAAGAETVYAYDTAGRVASVTNALGNVVTYTYDVRGNKTYEGGATYPVTYAYDLFGQKTQMVTYRDEDAEEATGDVTTWTYDEATGALIAKTYADGHGVTYTLTDKGQVATRTDARGKVTTYTYDVYGSLLSQDYSDTTPDIAYTYDTLGRQVTAIDAVGTTTFTYNVYGDLESESVSGVYNKTLIRYYDTYGRGTGYTIDGTRTLVKEYDTATGRISRAQMGGGWFVWDYLTGTNLKSQLTYPNGATATWTYEPTRDLLTSVTNQVNGNVISAYAYTNDVHGRRTSISKAGTMMAQDEVQPYTYNTRDELISGQGLTYNYDDIGNRIEAEGRDYTTNNLNQYTAIDTFTPTYDLDGNQTTIQTSTGVWTVEYNAENRPIRWTQGNIVIEMAYDRMGRRIVYHETRNGSNYINAKFVYDGYLCIQRLYGGSNGVYQSFVWDPTEQVATRPLCMQVPSWGSTVFYMHDGNKNVSDVIYYAVANGIAAHYDYAPFGAVTRTARDTRMTGRDFIGENPFRFSSEYHDNTLGLVYYNYRHYNPTDGRWCGRDPIEEEDDVGLYCMIGNSPCTYNDFNGLITLKDLFLQSVEGGYGGEIAFPIPPVPGFLVFSGSVNGSFYECCNAATKGCEVWIEGGVRFEIFYRSGTPTKKNEERIKGNQRNQRVPHPCKPGETVKKKNYVTELEKCNREPKKDRGGNLTKSHNTLKKCPSASEWGVDGSAFIRGTVGFGIGASFAVEFQFKRPEESYLENLSAHVSTGWVGVGASIEAGGSVTITGTTKWRDASYH